MKKVTLAALSIATALTIALPTLAKEGGRIGELRNGMMASSTVSLDRATIKADKEKLAADRKAEQEARKKKLDLMRENAKIKNQAVTNARTTFQAEKKAAWETYQAALKAATQKRDSVIKAAIDAAKASATTPPATP